MTARFMAAQCRHVNGYGVTVVTQLSQIASRVVASALKKL